MNSLAYALGLVALTASLAADDARRVAAPEERGTIEDRREAVRGDTGKWRDEARLQVSPPPGPGPLDDWADSLDLKNIALSSAGSAWLIYRTEQLDDNDRVWVESVERTGSSIEVVFVRATWEGNYSKNFTWYSVTGVDLGKLDPGDYEVTWIEKPLVFRHFVDPKDHRNSWPADEGGESGDPAVATITFTVSEP